MGDFAVQPLLLPRYDGRSFRGTAPVQPARMAANSRAEGWVLAETILVVDDDADTSVLAAALLQRVVADQWVVGESPR